MITPIRLLWCTAIGHSVGIWLGLQHRNAMNAVACQSPLLPLARSRHSCLPASPRRSSTNNTLRSSLHAQFIHDASCNDAAAISTAMRTCAISKQSKNCTLQKAGLHCPLHQVNPLPLLPCTDHLRAPRALHFLPALLSSLKFVVLFLFARSFFFFFLLYFIPLRHPRRMWARVGFGF